MGLEEEVLISETNKVVKQILQKRELDRNKKQNVQVNIVPEDREFPPEPPTFEPTAHLYPVKEADSRDEFQEREIARLLIAFGGEVFDVKENVTVAEYILVNIEEVMEDFENKQYQKIIKECLDRVVAKEQLSPQYFIGHKNHELSALAVDLLHSPYEYHPWEERGYPLRTQKIPEENFTKETLKTLQYFTLLKTIKLFEKNQLKLKDINVYKDHITTNKLLKVQVKLNEIRSSLSKELGGFNVLKYGGLR